ncbi:MAG: response regulator transcription factor [Marinifilaceae bacterium]|jgi:DNA-binding NarL/FixJ family response regulator
MSKTTFIIADPSFLIRKGLKLLIQKLENTETIHEIESKDQLTQIMNHEKPDILIVNPTLLDHSQNCPRDSFKNSDLKVILLSSSQNECTPFIADGVIQYMDPQNKILDLLKEIKSNIDTREPLEKDTNGLSSREKNILQHIAQGLTNKEIADKLFISIHTVVTHRKHITRKLGIKSVSGLTVYAILNNLVSMDEIK